MQVFKDKAGRDWAIEINVAARKKVMADTGVDLFTAVDGTLQQKLQDPETLVAVIFSIVEAQAKEQGISPETFGGSIVGDVIDDAALTMMKAIADFFPSRQRSILTKALAKGTELMDRATEKAMKQLDTMDVELLLQTMSNRSAGNSPGSSGSAPVPTP